MTGKKNTVKVTILGGEYTLRTETTPEHALAVAAANDPERGVSVGVFLERLVNEIERHASPEAP